MVNRYLASLIWALNKARLHGTPVPNQPIFRVFALRFCQFEKTF
ncbi:hypothetical protein BH09VER1_BH09VER1_27880 [soil metagenome]